MRERDLKLIWKHTHRDYRINSGGVRKILILREGGTHLVPLTELTGDEIDDLLLGIEARSKPVAKDEESSWAPLKERMTAGAPVQQCEAARRDYEEAISQSQIPGAAIAWKGIRIFQGVEGP